MNEQEYKIKGWVARDENNLLCVYTSRPHYDQNLHIWENSQDWFEIDENYFPEVQYYSEPIEVELIIKKI